MIDQSHLTADQVSECCLDASGPISDHLAHHLVDCATCRLAVEQARKQLQDFGQTIRQLPVAAPRPHVFTDSPADFQWRWPAFASLVLLCLIGGWQWRTQWTNQAGKTALSTAAVAKATVRNDTGTNNTLAKPSESRAADDLQLLEAAQENWTVPVAGGAPPRALQPLSVQNLPMEMD
jgi:hypothetical protein